MPVFKHNFFFFNVNFFFLKSIIFTKLTLPIQFIIYTHFSLLGPESTSKRKQASLKFFFFLFYLLKHFFTKKINQNFCLFFKHYKINKLNIRVFNVFKNILKKKSIRFKSWLSISQLFYFLLKTLEHKDSDFFIFNLKNFLYFLPLFFYKKVFSFILIFFRVFMNFFMKKYSLLGIFFSLRGKLGLKGGLKKKRLLYKFKKSSFSNTQLKLNYSQDFLQTPVGSIGLKFFIFY